MTEAPTEGVQPRSMAVPLAAFAAGAVVALLVGVFGKVHDPTLAGTTTLGFRTVISMKVVLSVAIAALAVLQFLGALWMYGRFGRAAPAWVGPAHRASGAVALGGLGPARGRRAALRPAHPRRADVGGLVPRRGVSGRRPRHTSERGRSRR